MWEWQSAVAVAAFLFTAAVFGFFIVRAIRMEREASEHLSRLPVEDRNDDSNTPRSDES